MTIHRSIFIPVTAVTIDGERIEVPHLHDAAAFLLSLPLFLMIAFGGLLGVGIGAPAALCFDAIIRGTSNSARKAGLLLVLVIAACLVYGVAAAVFVNVVLPPLALRW